MSALERRPGASHTPRTLECGEFRAVSSSFLRWSSDCPVYIVSSLFTVLQWSHKIDPQTKSSSPRNKTLVKLMNHLVSRTRSFTPVSSTGGGGGGGSGIEGSYGRMTRRGSLSCPSLVHGEPSHPRPSIISSLLTQFF